MKHETFIAGNVEMTWQTWEVKGVLKGTSAVTVAGRPVAFTLSELVVLEYLMRRKSELVPQPELSEHLYDGAPIAATSNVIEVMVSRIRKKLKAAGADIVIRTVRSRGYMLVEGEAT